MNNETIEKIRILGTIFVLMLGLMLFVGWIKAGYNLTQCDFKSNYKCEVINTAGLFIPLGGVVGYLNIRDGEKKDETK